MPESGNAQRGATLKRGRTLTRPDRNQAPAPMLSGKDNRRPFDAWVLFSRIITFWAPSFLISKCGLPDKAVRQAWREKVALCILIAFICAIVAFLTLGLPYVFCPQSSLIDSQNSISVSAGTPGTFGVNGVMWKLSDLQSAPDELKNIPASSDQTNRFQHVTTFPECQKNSILNFEAVKQDPCATAVGYAGCTLGPINIVQQTYNLVNLKKSVGYDWSDLVENYFVVDGIVMNLSPYMQANPNPAANDLLDWTIREAIKNKIVDATRLFVRHPELKDCIPCLQKKFMAGHLSKASTGCFGVKLFFIVSMVVILGIVMCRFIMAVIFDWLISFKLARPPPKSKTQPIVVSRSSPWALHQNSSVSSFSVSNTSLPQVNVNLNSSELFTVLLVTCYSEGESSIRCTIESLAGTEYGDDHKLLFIIADGIITGSGNDRSTPDICVDLLEIDPAFANPEPMSYIAVAAGAKQHNMAKVYAGHFNHKGHRVPTVVVVKCGTPEEQSAPKPGNRGKRDSQLILMNFFSRVTYNDRMTPLDYDLFKKTQHLMGVTPDYFEIVLMVDADTKVYPDSLRLLINCVQNDPLIMGLCGETKIANKRDSWVTAIQVFEYYISHHLGKGFESVFGGVTCLPGCFCMYRLKARKGDNDWVPIITKPEIVQEYSQNVVETLHQKNLLLLGEDRFLTTLMLRNFPNRKMMFVPQAVCKTVVPDEFKVLLSQRRRWINSTIHNLLELSLVRNLCGTFCFSMQFVVVMELIGTVSLPVAIIMTFVLIINLANTTFVDASSYFPLILLLLILFLPAVLILLTTRKLIYIAWMLIYLLALPVWNFALPVYAYWHFDDFSWGETRRVDGESKGDDHGKKEGVFDSSKITLRRWEDYERRHIRTMKRRERRRLKEMSPTHLNHTVLAGDDQDSVRGLMVNDAESLGSSYYDGDSQMEDEGFDSNPHPGYRMKNVGKPF
ncbi:hypothetical protein K493DRAFT_210639 [Basidiobolus meristosporus CBS 931.73]|uniref:chitin synthase n=1 Tax=Basidiobolus meristosporus CBS 931.73 TaxID=1314790 RepID=A0A1Y1YSE9_9FUNG|nr:hypothetical protein K493DRAFT_210639 [Basidiobolus meristosporus CBS 931.73]|eukprot:ORY00677.1 hypothetical protein K493DRAFT_210639 [Basidiobolus meristosporus CBS 931.73]